MADRRRQGPQSALRVPAGSPAAGSAPSEGSCRSSPSPKSACSIRTATSCATSSGQDAGRTHEGWACYHTELLAFDLDGVGEVGIVGCAVGAPFAVLVAEQLFASGCRLLVSVTSAGQITPIGPTPYFVLIDRALRDEGTSYHYLPPARSPRHPMRRCLRASNRLARALPGIALHRGATWTTDAPYRETEAAIARARDLGRARRRDGSCSPLRLRADTRPSPSSALRMSRMPWHRPRETSKRARPTARTPHLPFSPRQHAPEFADQELNEQSQRDRLLTSSSALSLGYPLLQACHCAVTQER